MNANLIVTIVLALAIIIFIFARQLMERPVTQRGLLLPLAICVLLGVLYLAGLPTGAAILLVAIGLVFGVGTGLVSGQLMRVWRDATGTVLQRGGWRYLIVIIALLLVRVAIRFGVIASGITVDEVALNYAFIAAIVGNFVGRDIVIALRALKLAGGSFANLSSQ